MAIFNLTILDNPVRAWLAALAIFAAIMLSVWIARRVFSRNKEILFARSDGLARKLVTSLFLENRPWLWLVFAVYFAVQALTLPAGVLATLRAITVTALVAQAAFWGTGLIDFWIARKVDETEGANVTSLWALGLLAKIGLWTLAFLLALDNIPGIQVTSLIASLGVTGIAVALAVQSILGDLFASLTIALDQPFELGDSIAVGEFTGTVEHIGLKSTRLRSLTGEQLIFSNSDLLDSRIRNYKRMERRRALFSIGVEYNTPHDKLAAVPQITREIVEGQALASFERVHLKKLGDFAIEFEIVYFVESAGMTEFMDVQQAVNLDLIRRFEQEGINFAFPTQTLQIQR